MIKKYQIASSEAGIEQANKLREVKDMAANYLSAPKKINNRVYTPNTAPPINGKIFEGLVKTFSHQIATEKGTQKAKVLDPIIKNIKQVISKEEMGAFRPYLEKLSNAKDNLNSSKGDKIKSNEAKIAITLATKELSKAMSEYMESQDNVVAYIRYSVKLRKIRDAFKSLEKPPVFDETPIAGESKNKVLDVIKLVNRETSQLLESDFDCTFIINTISEIITAIGKRL